MRCVLEIVPIQENLATTFTAQENGEDEENTKWMLDSGATYHLTINNVVPCVKMVSP